MNPRILILLAALPLAFTALRPTPQQAAKAAPYEKFVQKYCSNCHEPEKLDRIKVHDRLLAGEMPPKEAKLRPSAAETTAFLNTLANH